LPSHRLLCLGFTLVPLFANVQAQTSVVPPRRFGVNAGINSSTIAYGETNDASRLTGLYAGVLFIIPTTPTFSIQPELAYSMKGVKQPAVAITPSGNQTIAVTARLNYVEIPVLGRFDIPASGNVKPFAYAGPALALKLSCVTSGSAGSLSFKRNCDEADDRDVETFDYGAIAGGGLAFDVRGRSFTIGARYTYGLGNLLDDGTAKNRTISVLASIEFPWPR
jgi:hypothetical protein